MPLAMSGNIFQEEMALYKTVFCIEHDFAKGTTNKPFATCLV